MHARCHVFLLLELLQLQHYLPIRVAEDLLDFIDAESAAGGVVGTVLEVTNVNMVASGPNVLRQHEETGAVKPMRRWLEVVPKELEELGEVLGERAAVVDAKLLEEGGGHEHNRVRVQAP